MCDSTSIAMHTVNRAQVRPGTNAAVFGAGVMGLLVAECATVVGAANVIVVGRGERLKRAAALGYQTVDSSSRDPVAKVRASTGGLGVEVSLECAGAPDTIRWAVDVLRKGGRCSVIGIPLEAVALPIQANGFGRTRLRRCPGQCR
jgi:L-iditol 2-dehydrogenase